MNFKLLKRSWQALLVFAFILITAAPVPPPGPTWRVETVDSPKWIKYPSANMLKLYNNQPRVAYGGDRLYYASSDDNGASWTLLTIDPSDGVGGRTALVLDGSGNPYIGYFDDANRNLKFAGMDPNDPGQWYYETVDTNSSGDYLAIALDSLNQPHLVYFAASALDHAWRTCSGSIPSVTCTWHTEQLLAGVNPNNISLAISTTDKLHIAFMSGSDYHLHYLVQGGSGANCVGNTYRCDVVDATTNAGQDGISLRLYGDLARIAYGIPADGQHFAYYDGSTWHTVLINGTGGFTPSLQLTAGGLPRILFTDDNGIVRVLSGTTSTGGTWSFSDVTGGVLSWGSSGAIKTTGDLSVVYWQSPLGYVMYNHQSSGTWQSGQVFDLVGIAGMNLSLAIDGSDQVHIAYQDALKNHLRYATQFISPLDCGSATGPWKCETVNDTFSGGGVGADNSLALDQNGYPTISFADYTANYFQDFARYVGSGGNCPGNDAWDCEIVASDTIWAGFDNSLAIGPSPDYAPHIAFFDYGGSSLWLATYVGSGGDCPGGHTAWACEIVDASQGSNAGYTSLALKSDGKAVISYYNSNTNSLRLAMEVTSGAGGCNSADNPANWKCITVADNLGEYDVRNSLALASDSEARISFHDADDTDPGGGGLKYAVVSLPGGSVTLQTVDSGPYAGTYNALALYGGQAMIAYHIGGASTNALRFAQWVGSGSGNCPANSDWNCSVIDGRRNLGQYVDLGVTSYGTPYVAYYDPLTGDLLAAHLVQFWGFLPITIK